MASFWTWFWDEIGRPVAWAAGTWLAIDFIDALFGQVAAVLASVVAASVLVWVLWRIRSDDDRPSSQGDQT